MRRQYDPGTLGMRRQYGALSWRRAMGFRFELFSVFTVYTRFFLIEALGLLSALSLLQ